MVLSNRRGWIVDAINHPYPIVTEYLFVKEGPCIEPLLYNYIPKKPIMKHIFSTKKPPLFALRLYYIINGHGEEMQYAQIGMSIWSCHLRSGSIYVFYGSHLFLFKRHLYNSHHFHLSLCSMAIVSSIPQLSVWSVVAVCPTIYSSCLVDQDIDDVQRGAIR